MAQRTLIRGATVVTMDAQGDLPQADILVTDDTITGHRARRCRSTRPGGGRHRLHRHPGLINAHMHTWQTALRGVAANWTLLQYFQNMHAGLATAFTPETCTSPPWWARSTSSTAAPPRWWTGATTTPHPAHNDAAVTALLAVRHPRRVLPRHAQARPQAGPDAVLGGAAPARRGRAPAEGAPGQPLLSVHAAVLGPHYSTLDVALHDFRMAQELGVIASLHQGGGPARTPDGWERLEERGLLGRTSTSCTATR
jgi:hypothetical protein